MSLTPAFLQNVDAMSRQVEQALLSLMPAHGSDLPPSLVELTASLLAQSWNRASTLKAEEEVARLYACANIACERFKIALDLPPIEPRPPIPPRIYKRLYTHLEKILPSPSDTPRVSRISTPSAKKQVSDSSPTPGSRRLPSRGTPSKEATLSQFRTRSQAIPRATVRSNGRGKVPAQEKTGLYAWVQPAIRFLCAEAEMRTLAPTVLAGAEFIMAPGGQRTNDDWANQHATELVAVVFFFVMLRVRTTASGKTMDREGYVPLRKEIIAQLTSARTQVESQGMDEVDFWQGWKSLNSKEFDAAVIHVNKTDWLAGDWYQGLADVLDTSQRGEPAVTHGGDGDSGAQLPTRRADTMLQEQYDLLSEARRSDYQTWRVKMLSKMEPHENDV